LSLIYCIFLLFNVNSVDIVNYSDVLCNGLQAICNLLYGLDFYSSREACKLSVCFLRAALKDDANDNELKSQSISVLESVCKAHFSASQRNFLCQNISSWGEEEEGEDCAVCMFDKATVIFLPCGHICMCTSCCNHFTNSASSGNTYGRNCIICRTKIFQRISIR
jgi:hypothetical protein